MSRTSNFALRLQTSLKAEAERVAKAENTTLNQFINVAVAEKLAALRTEAYFRSRSERADVEAALKSLERSGSEGLLQAGDEETHAASEAAPSRRRSRGRT